MGFVMVAAFYILREHWGYAFGTLPLRPRRWHCPPQAWWGMRFG